MNGPFRWELLSSLFFFFFFFFFVKKCDFFFNRLLSQSCCSHQFYLVLLNAEYYTVRTTLQYEGNWLTGSRNQKVAGPRVRCPMSPYQQ
jgi:hypothetical protein